MAMVSVCFLTLNTVSVLDALFIVHRSITLSFLLFYPSFHLTSFSSSLPPFSSPSLPPPPSLSVVSCDPVNYTMEQDLTLRAYHTTFWMYSGRGVAPTGGTYLQYRATWHAHVLCFQWNARYLQCNVMQANFDCIKWLRNYLNTSEFNSFV